MCVYIHIYVQNKWCTKQLLTTQCPQSLQAAAAPLFCVVFCFYIYHMVWNPFVRFRSSVLILSPSPSLSRQYEKLKGPCLCATLLRHS